MFTTTTLDLPPSQARSSRPAPNRAPGEEHAARSSLLGLQRGSRRGRKRAVAAMEAEVLLRHLEWHGEVYADALAAELARSVPRAVPHPVLRSAARGGNWRAAARQHACADVGAAARVAPLGAALSGDLSAVVQQAGRAARVTHTHPDGVAGAVAVAVASACFARGQVAPYQLWPAVLCRMPPGPVREQVAAASELASSLPPPHAARILSAHEGDLAIHVVPFALWCAARHPNNVEGAVAAARGPLRASEHTSTITGGVVGARAWPKGP